jgi:hypothetical protein
MEKEEFKELLKKANLSKKEFAGIINISVGSLNNWGSTQNIPYWVKSWLENYIKAKNMDKVAEAISPYVKDTK